MSNIVGKAYAMNVLTPSSPKITWINRLLFMAARGLPERLMGLLGLSLIHFARWVIIKPDDWPDLGQGKQQLDNDYMLFCSNFNGTWDQYIDAFSEGIPSGLNLFWFSATKYPLSIPITPFKNYIAHNQINTDYLVFCADIDAVEADGDPLPETLSSVQQHSVRDSYARELWSTMEPELAEIYSNCYGFEHVQTADDFAVYLDKCHVETTMPFHDYYLKLPEFNRFPLKLVLAAVALPALIALLALVLRIFGMIELPILGWNVLATFIIGMFLAIGAVLFGIVYALRKGEKPLTPAKFDDLPSVLKGLYTQQKFSNFVVDHQGAKAEKLHSDFGAFLRKHKPSDICGPTQPSGVISTAIAEEASL